MLKKLILKDKYEKLCGASFSFSGLEFPFAIAQKQRKTYVVFLCHSFLVILLHMNIKNKRLSLNSIFLAFVTEMLVKFSLLYAPAKVQIKIFVVERNCAIILLHLLLAIRFKLNIIKKLKHKRKKVERKELRALPLRLLRAIITELREIKFTCALDLQLRASKIHLRWKP